MNYCIVPTNWSTVWPKTKTTLIKYAPQILTGIGIDGMAGATIIAVKNTPAYKQAIADKKEELGMEKLPMVDILKIGFRYYVVPTGMTIAGAVCIMKSCAISQGRVQGFAALAASEAMQLKEYQKTVREKIGEKKEKDITDETAKRTVEKELENTPIEDHQIEETGHGNQIIYFPLLGRWFRCDISWIRRIENEVNEEIAKGDVNEHDPFDTRTLQGVCLNQFLAGLGLNKSDIGVLLGWNGANRLHITFTDVLTGKPSEKAVVLEMRMDDCIPREGWDTKRQNHSQHIRPF
jgi:hypothetical protein